MVWLRLRLRQRILIFCRVKVASHKENPKLQTYEYAQGASGGIQPKHSIINQVNLPLVSIPVLTII